MLDAVILANTLYEMPDSKLESITAALGEYYEARYDHAVADLVSSQHMARLLAGQVNPPNNIGKIDCNGARNV